MIAWEWQAGFSAIGSPAQPRVVQEQQISIRGASWGGNTGMFRESWGTDRRVSLLLVPLFRSIKIQLDRQKKERKGMRNEMSDILRRCVCDDREIETQNKSVKGRKKEMT